MLHFDTTLIVEQKILFQKHNDEYETYCLFIFVIYKLHNKLALYLNYTTITYKSQPTVHKLCLQTGQTKSTLSNKQ